ncbi:MAG: putative phage tail protein [Lachnospiraceae bacterium]
MYSQSQYGVMKYGSFETDENSGEYYEDLLDLVPDYLKDIRELKELYTAQGYQVGHLRHVLDDTINQCFISTASYALDRIEQIFGIEPNMALTYEWRRDILMAKLRGHGTTTKKMIKETAAAFSGGEVEISEDNARYCFVVRFIGIKGIPVNMQGFVKMLEEIKPAHMTYQFEYRYTIWGELQQSYSWERLGSSGTTWNDVKTLKEN